MHYLPTMIVMLSNPKGRQIIGYTRPARTTILYQACGILQRVGEQNVFASTKSRYAPTHQIRLNPIVEVFCEIVPELDEYVGLNNKLTVPRHLWEIIRNVVGSNFIPHQSYTRGDPYHLLYPY